MSNIEIGRGGGKGWKGDGGSLVFWMLPSVSFLESETFLRHNIFMVVEVLGCGWKGLVKIQALSFSA